MKAVTWHGIGDIRLEDVPEPRIQDPLDAVIEVTTAAICGTDLHFVRGSMPGMREGTVLGHEAVGVVREVGPQVRNLREGDRVVVGSTIGCGSCSYCRAGYYAQCDNANPNGPRAGTAFFGGPESTGAFDGLQAEYARIPFAHVGLVPLPDSVDDQQAILLSDIVPTAWFGGRLAEVGKGDTVAIVGAGPVGQCAVPAARLQGAGRIIVVDGVADRLELARDQHAEVVDFNREDPVETVVELTRGVGVDRVIDAVGVDAMPPHGEPGDAPTQAAEWAVQMVAKAGTIGTIGVYPPTVDSYPFGQAMNKNLTLKMGNCNHRRYLPELVGLTASGALDTTPLVTRWARTEDAVDAYRNFEHRTPGWTKVALEVSTDGIPPGLGTGAGTGTSTTAGTATRGH